MDNFKSLLQIGDIVQFKDGWYGLVIIDKFISPCTYMLISSYDDNLKVIDRSRWSIPCDVSRIYKLDYSSSILHYINTAYTINDLKIKLQDKDWFSSLITLIKAKAPSVLQCIHVASYSINIF